MAGSRFNLAPVVRGHWKGLTDGRSKTDAPDLAARAVLIAAPIALFAAAWQWGWTLAAPAGLFAGVALLAGSLVGSFSHLSSLRLKVTEWRSAGSESLDRESDMLDETAAHLLMAVVACVVDAVLIVIGMNLSTHPGAGGGLVTEPVSGVWAAAAIAVSGYIVLIFLMIVPRMYAAYVSINRVRRGLSGFAR